MREMKVKLAVGIFGLFCLGTLGLLVFAFGGGQNLFMSTYDINVRFKDIAGGLQSGQSVTLKGKRIGQTKKVEFWDPGNVASGIRVIVAVDSEVLIPQGADMKVGANLMGFGKPALTIDVYDLSGAPSLTTDGSAVIMGSTISPIDQMLPPEMQHSLTAAVEGFTKLSESLTPVAENLTVLLEQRDISIVDANQAAANIATLVQRFDLVLKNLNVVLADMENVENLKATFANARTMSERGVAFMDKLDRLGDQGLVLATDATALLRDMRGSIEKLSTLLTEFNKTGATLNDTKGTVGLLLNDNRLYEELILSARRLSAALDELRAAMEVMKKEGFKVKL
ncbi:MAG TPA: MlaD family protein [Phycisphaerae bacterium]|nr:MlaD family protein [Phycisphaerae bacterium]